MRPSVRVRIVGWVVLLLVAGMTVAGVATYTVLEARLDTRIDQRLAQEIEEFRAMARSGTDPRTGAAITDVRGLFRAALRQNVPAGDETLFTLVGGEPYRRSAARPPVRLDTQHSTVRELASGKVPRYGTLELQQGRARYAVIPARVAGDPARGRYVVAVFRWIEHRQIAHTMTTFAAFGAGSVVAIGVVAWFVSGRLLAPVALVRRTAHEITDTDLTRRIPVVGRDDVSELARTFNAMLDRLEEAFRTQRQFLDDAGHELRTPITVLRGHLELLDQDGDPAEIADTKALVLDEIDRMSRMVEDLVTLAKAQRPDFLAPGPVELAQLTEDVYDKAAALGSRSWHLDARAEATVAADGQRLTQALIQLAQNAVTHTQPGETVAVGSTVEEGTVRLWVRDTGPGVAPDDTDRIFERFSRGTETRGEGSGLGLAIVRAIAEAHGGDATVESRPGFGARFVLEFPAVAAAQDAEVCS